MVILPKYISPHERDYKDYTSSLKPFNMNFQKRVSQFLKERLDGEGLSYSVLTTGSDGRYEKGPVSEIEFIVLTNMRGDDFVKDAMITHDELLRLRDLIECYPQHLIAQNIEIKDLSRDSMSRYQNDSKRAFPTRIMDSVYLVGKDSFWKKAKTLLVKEFQGSEASSIRNNIKRRKAIFKKSMESGEQKYRKDMHIRHYDLDEGVSFYDPCQYALSFKAGPLRYVQFALMQDIIRFCRSHDESVSRDLLLYLPTNTEDRFHYLETEDLLALTHRETSDVTNIYNYFLWLFHRAQEDFKKEGLSEMSFDKDEVRERINSLSKILGKSFIK